MTTAVPLLQPSAAGLRGNWRNYTPGSAGNEALDTKRNDFLLVRNGDHAICIDRFVIANSREKKPYLSEEGFGGELGEGAFLRRNCSTVVEDVELVRSGGSESYVPKGRPIRLMVGYLSRFMGSQPALHFFADQAPTLCEKMRGAHLISATDTNPRVWA